MTDIRTKTIAQLPLAASVSSVDKILIWQDNVLKQSGPNLLLPLNVPVVTSTSNGLMTSSDKIKLDKTFYNVYSYGATGDGTTNDRVAIQNAINAANAAGGGIVYFPKGKYLIGSTGLTVYQNVILFGEVTRYAGSTTRGTSIIYNGTGIAIYGENILDFQINGLDIDCTGTSGSSVRGVYLNGVWKSTLRNLTVRGVSVSRGYAILLDTNSDAFGPPSPANAWGGQHNYLEQCEVQEGIIRFVGGGVNDGVTTTVCNTIRGDRYEIVSSQIVFLNSTAECATTGGSGFDFSGVGTAGLLVGCNIEGSFTDAIKIDSNSEVREIGTTWGGFTGTSRVTGNTSSLRSYGGFFEFIRQCTANVPVKVQSIQDPNAEYLTENFVPTNVTGGSQSGHFYTTRRIAGTVYTDHNWRQHAFIEKEISTSSTSAVTIFTIPVPNGAGLRLSAHATGLQVGNDVYSNYRECVVRNSFGTVTVVQQTQQTNGDPGAINFVASGTDVLVQWTPTTTNASTGTMNLEIRGPWTGYS